MKFLPFIWRQLTRNKLRTALTAGAIGLAVALVCLLLTMPAGMDALLDDVASNSRIVVHNEAGLVYPLPYSYLQKIRAKEGVVGAASWTWFGGAFREEKGVEFPNFAIEPDPIGVVWEPVASLGIGVEFRPEECVLTPVREGSWGRIKQLYEPK